MLWLRRTFLLPVMHPAATKPSCSQSKAVFLSLAKISEAAEPSECRACPQGMCVHLDSTTGFRGWKDAFMPRWAGSPKLCLEPWVGRNSSRKNLIPKYVKGMLQLTSVPTSYLAHTTALGGLLRKFYCPLLQKVTINDICFIPSMY